VLSVVQFGRAVGLSLPSGDAINAKFGRLHFANGTLGKMTAARAARLLRCIAEHLRNSASRIASNLSKLLLHAAFHSQIHFKKPLVFVTSDFLQKGYFTAAKRTRRLLRSAGEDLA